MGSLVAVFYPAYELMGPASQALPINSTSNRRTEAGGMIHEPAT